MMFLQNAMVEYPSVPSRSKDTTLLGVFTNIQYTYAVLSTVLFTSGSSIRYNWDFGLVLYSVFRAVG